MKKITRIACITLIIGYYSCKPVTPSAEWANYKGPNKNGIVNDTNWSAEKLDTSNILWEVNVGYGHTEIIVKDKRCYVAGWDTATGDSITTMYCLNTATGETIWERPFKKGWVHWEGPRSTPTLENDSLYNLFWDGQLVCLSATNGETIWERHLEADSLGKGHERWGHSTAPVLYGNLLFFNIGKTGLAINKNDGSTAWHSNNKGFTFCSPIIHTINETDYGFFICDSTLSMVEAATGIVQWQYELLDGFITIDPAMYNNNIYLFNELIAVGPQKADSVWRNDTISPMFTNGVIKDGYGYYIWRSGRRKTQLVCMKIATGTILWNEEMNKWGSLLMAGNKLIINKGDGVIAIAKATPEGYSEEKSAHIIDRGRTKEGFCWTTPTLVDGKLYIRNFGGDIACVDLSVE